MDGWRDGTKIEVYFIFLFFYKMDSSNLQSTQQLIRKDNQLKPVDKYKLWIERIKFFYPVSTQGDRTEVLKLRDDILSLRQSLIDAFNVIGKIRLNSKSRRPKYRGGQ